MKKLVCLMVGLFLVGIVGAANATLIGDTIYAGHKTNGNMQGEQSKQVFAGTSDAIDMFGFYSVDANASEIIVSFVYDTQWGPYGSFNGLVVWDLDDSSNNVLQDITVLSYPTGYDKNRITFSDHQVEFDWDGLSINAGIQFKISLDYGATTPGGPDTGATVPEPATMFLFGIGLLGFAGVNRKKEK